MTNRITIFKNKKKLEEKHPDFNAMIKIEETLTPGEYQAGLYIKVKEGGLTYKTGTIKPVFKHKFKDNTKSIKQPEKTKNHTNFADDFDDEIPI